MITQEFDNIQKDLIIKTKHQIVLNFINAQTYLQVKWTSKNQQKLIKRIIQGNKECIHLDRPQKMMSQKLITEQLLTL